MRASGIFVMALAVGTVASVANIGQAQLPGPMDQSSLRNPLLETPPQPSGLPYKPGQQSARVAAANQPDINQDILVTDKQGPWMIFMTSYTGKEAAVMARQMVMELRNNYQMPAFVFNHGTDEKQKEDARVKAIIEKQRQFLAEKGLPSNTPLRVRRTIYETQCAVLVGNYPDDNAARRALAEMRRLKLDPKRVQLAKIFDAEVDEKTGKIIKFTREEFINPFNSAFVIQNPILKVDRTRQVQENDLAVMKQLSRGEDYSLFNCPKPYTLVIKQFTTPTVTQPRSGSGSFLAALGLNKTGDGVDNAAHNAHNLAELMRKSFQLEAYVLHTRHSSIVTVGGFDSLGDPRMRSTQEMLVNRLKVPSAMPMAVPR